MSIQQSKRRNRKPTRKLRPGALATELRSQWREQHPDIESQNRALSDHIARARSYELPADITPESLVAQVMHTYLTEREQMTTERVQALGARSLSAASDKVTFESFIPNTDTAPLQDILDVSRGIAIAKIALRNTI